MKTIHSIALIRDPRLASGLRMVTFALCFSFAAFAGKYEVKIDLRSQMGPSDSSTLWMGEWEETEGYPKIPVHHFRWLVPANEEVVRVNTTHESRIGASVPFAIERTPRYLPQCNVELPDSEIAAFRAGELYPLTPVGKFRKIRKHIYNSIEVPIYPYQIMVSEAMAVPIDAFTLTIETRLLKKQDLRTMVLPTDLEEAKRMIGESEHYSSYTPPLENMRDLRGATFLVIGPQEYLSDLATWQRLEEKASRGITTTTHSLESIQSGFSGKDIQEKIRNAVRKHYQDDGTRFVLLIGNGYSLLPTRNFALDGESIGSDIYFGCFDAELDLACEVAVGRAPVSNLSEYKVFVTKTLGARQAFAKKTAKEKSKTLIFGEKMDGSTLAGNALEQLIKGGKAGSITTIGYPATANVVRFNETFAQTFSSSQVIAKLNEGGFFTVNHMGHASNSYCMRYQSSEIGKLNNPIGFFGITQGCHPGDLHGPNWAAKMVLHPTGGAFAQIANSSYGWYSPGSSDGPSNRHHLVFYDSIFNEGTKELGKANMRAKERLLSQANSNLTLKKVLVETNLFGDPEFKLTLE